MSRDVVNIYPYVTQIGYSYWLFYMQIEWNKHWFLICKKHTVTSWAQSRNQCNKIRNNEQYLLFKRKRWFIYALTLEIQRSDIYPNISKIYMPDGLYKLPVGYNSNTVKLLSFIVPILLMNRLRHSLSKVTYLGFEHK